MAITTNCSMDRYCMAQEELPRQKLCWETAEPHSTLCELHGGVGDLESFQQEWEFWIKTEEEICEHIDDGEEPEKIAAFKRGDLPR